MFIIKRLWFLQKNRTDLSSISAEQSGPVFLAHPVHRPTHAHTQLSSKRLFDHVHVNNHRCSILPPVCHHDLHIKYTASQKVQIRCRLQIPREMRELWCHFDVKRSKGQRSRGSQSSDPKYATYWPKMDAFLKWRERPHILSACGTVHQLVEHTRVCHTISRIIVIIIFNTLGSKDPKG